MISRLVCWLWSSHRIFRGESIIWVPKTQSFASACWCGAKRT